MDTACQSQTVDWLLNIQRKLYQWSKKYPDEPYRDLWNWVIDPRNLERALGRVESNTGRNTPGVDGITCRMIQEEIGRETFIFNLRQKLKKGTYAPQPVRRRWIPKPGKPDQRRGLGIPTVEDRVVQGAIKQIIEPIFEARFLHVSFGFRPGRAVRDAIELIRGTTQNGKRDEQGKRITTPYPWIIEGDIQACFDHISHHALMKRLRRAISDRKANRLILAFLKAGILEEGKFFTTDEGTPQGGILSPLLANIALGVIEERYRKWLDPIKNKGALRRQKDRYHSRAIFYPIRYADDFIILCSGTQEEARREKERLARYLKRRIGVSLSLEKTKVTALSEGCDFLGHRIRQIQHNSWGYYTQAFAPPDRQKRLRDRIRAITQLKTTGRSLGDLLSWLNPILQGWSQFYRHTTQAKKVFHKMDTFLFWRIYGWLMRKHPKSGKRAIYAKYMRRCGKHPVIRWSDGDQHCVKLGQTPCERWSPKSRKLPRYMHPIGEPGT